MPKERVMDPRSIDPSSGIDAALTVRWTKDGKREPNCSPLVEPLVVTYDLTSQQATYTLNGIAAIIVLDRDACNRLIRALRKARDDVYGRDE